MSLTKAVAASAVGHAKARDVYPQGGFGVHELGRHCQGGEPVLLERRAGGQTRSQRAVIDRWLPPRPYPHQVSDDGCNVAAHPAQVRQSSVTRGPYRRLRGGSTRLVLRGSATCAVGVALPRRPAMRSVVAQPWGVHSTRSPPARLRPQSAAAVLGLPRFDGQGWWLGQATCSMTSSWVVVSYSSGVW